MAHRKGRRLRARFNSSWNVAAEVMEPRALLSGPSMGQGISLQMDAGTTAGLCQGHNVTTDAAGNVYATFIFSGSGNINPGSGDVNLGSGANAYTISSSGTAGGAFAIAKYDSSMNLQWAVAPTQNAAQAWTVSATSVGSVSQDLYVAGTVGAGASGGTFQLPTTAGTTLSVPLAASATSQFIMRLDHATGNVVWFAEIARSSFASGGGQSIAVDGSENVYLAGAVSGTMQLSYLYGPGTGGVPVSYSVPSGCGTEYFLKFDSSGNAKWFDHFTPQVVTTTTKSQGTTTTTTTYGQMFDYGGTGSHLATDSAGNLYWTGSLVQGSVNADPNPNGPSNVIMAAHGFGDFVMEKIDPNGNLVWLNHNPSAEEGAVYVYGSEIAVDSNGNIDVSVGGGYEVSSTKVHGQTVTVTAYLLQFDTNDHLKWYQTSIANGYAGNDGLPLHGFGLDSSGNVYIPTRGAGSTPQSSIDKYTSAGTLIWSVAEGNVPNVGANHVTVDASGNIWWIGSCGTNVLDVGPPAQVSVSPTSTPYYLPIDPNNTGTGGTTGLLVEWTQPGGFAAAANTGNTTTGTAGVASNSTAPPATTPATQQVIYVGDIASGPAILPQTNNPDLILTSSSPGF